MSNFLPDFQKTKVAIIGLGYVGLPLAIEIAKCDKCYLSNKNLKRKVIGFDLNKERIESLNNGYDYTQEIKSDNFHFSKLINFTFNEEDLYEADVFIITVPTPVDSNNCPDFSFLESASKIVGLSLLKRKDKNSIPIVIYESTVYPGATEEICVPILEENSKLKYNSNDPNKCFYCGYSPERVNPGDKEHTLSKILKVTSGSNEVIANWINDFYGSFIEAGTFMAKSIKIAEAAKVIENTQRDLNIALINEFSIIFNKAGIDTLDVLEAAETKWNFLKFKPGLVGGHCIGVDPYYLTHKAQSLGYNPELVLAGRRINNDMATYFAENLLEKMAGFGNIEGLKILILGITFKENCPDMRNSKVLDFINKLANYKVDITVSDPYCLKNNFDKKKPFVCIKKIPIEKKFHAIVGAVNHNCFKKLTEKEYSKMAYKDCIFMDLKGMLPRSFSPLRP